jgi:SH3 domain protein
MTQVSGLGLFWFRRVIFACLLGLLLPALSQAAEKQAKAKTAAKTEQFYVTTHLQTGLHTKAAMDSPVIKLVRGGDALVILKSAKEFSEVQLKDGTTGWLYSQFITPEQPAEVRVVELENQLQDLQAQLQPEKQQSSVAEKNTTDAVLQKQINDYQETITQLKEELKAWEQLDFQDRQAQQKHANQINHELKQRLSKIAALATGQENSKIQIRVNDEGLQQEPLFMLDTLLKKDNLLMIVIGGVGFFLGIVIMDMINRRRHGGYRI